MPNKMLIDASHPEETRVVVVRGNRIEEFDFESQDKKQLKGNIYLARVTRVEPSLQAAFVEYGGNRHGFLAFSEIHPDYYQIPIADRQALLRAEAEEHDDEDDEGDERGRGNRRRRRGGKSRDRGDDAIKAAEGTEAAEAFAGPTEDQPAETNEAEPTTEANVAADEATPTTEGAESQENRPETSPVEDASSEIDASSERENAQPATDEDKPEGALSSIAAEVEFNVITEKLPQPSESDEGSQNGDNGDHHERNNDDHDHEVESIGAEDALEEVRNRRKPPRRHYKIQEVIKRRQILLVQVVKEERGNKGAALTTYLSLAGRYSVLMPNTARGGGISRKITNAQDRKRLKEVVADLEVPEGMGVILRTAGESRTKAEIKRDYEYLMRLWDNVRELTLKSIVPALVYEEGSLIKRSVRDLYNKDIDDIQVAGEDGYREAKDFMRMLMPSHAKVVQPYRDTTPLFARYGVEAQLDKMLQPQVTLKSGGYIIINQTEALVSIDVNSGRSTREHSIEETALHTNLEAAEEVARQLRLRDLAGLIVIDFIDMEENRNNRAVEKKLKDCLKNDRARIQLGRISHFGLMEMSRQRIRASVLESTMKPCPHCGGTGHVRSDSSVALLVVRAIEEFLLKDSRNHIIVKTPTATALYVLNHKRSTLADLEARFGLTITIEVDETLGAQHYLILRGAIAEKPAGFQEQQFLPPPPVEEEDDEIVIEEDEADDVVTEQAQQPPPRHGENGEEGHRKRRRRRRRRGGRDRDRPEGAEADRPQDAAVAEQGTAAFEADSDEADADAEGDEAGDAITAEAADNGQAKKRRRGKRGGKRNRREEGVEGQLLSDDAEAGESDSDETADMNDAVVGEVETAVSEEAATGVSEELAVEAIATVPAVESAADAEQPEEAPKKRRRAPRAKKGAAADVPAEDVAVEPVAEVASGAEAEAPSPATEEPAQASEPTAAAEAADADASAAHAGDAKAQAIPAEPEKPAEPVISSTTAGGDAAPAQDQPKRGGWWQRRSFF
jgi:ribonuclease E